MALEVETEVKRDYATELEAKSKPTLHSGGCWRGYVGLPLAVEKAKVGFP